MQGPQMRVPDEHHGSASGGWVLASDSLNVNSIVYSAGVGDDISFDLSLIHRYGVSVHAFDPTPRSIEWINKQIVPDRFLLHTVGIAHFDGVAAFHEPANPEFVSFSLVGGAAKPASHSTEAPVRRLGTLMRQFGHERVDLLKMDIEGAEYEVIEDLLEQRIPIRQILVEFHHRFPSIGAQRTRSAIHSLNRAGYRIFFVSDLGEEYSFLRISEDVTG